MYLGTMKRWIEIVWISMFVSRNVFGHYEEVDRALFRALFRALLGLYSGSTKVLQGFSECIERLLNSGIGGVRSYSAAVFTEYF